MRPKTTIPLILAGLVFLGVGGWATVQSVSQISEMRRALASGPRVPVVVVGKDQEEKTRRATKGRTRRSTYYYATVRGETAPSTAEGQRIRVSRDCYARLATGQRQQLVAGASPETTFLESDNERIRNAETGFFVALVFPIVGLIMVAGGAIGLAWRKKETTAL